MTLRIVTYIALAIFLVLYGLMAVTNFKAEFMASICGYAALAAGILVFVLAVRKDQAGV